MKIEHSWIRFKFLILLIVFVPINFTFGQSLEQKFVCPVCRIEFSAFVPPPGTENPRTTIDGNLIGQKLAPLPACPLCGGVFSGSEISEKQLKKLELSIWSADYQKDRHKSSYYRLAMLSEKSGAESLELAEHWLNAAWAAPEKTEVRKLALEKSSLYLKTYLSALNSEESHPELRIKLADILRQLGKFAESGRELNQAIKFAGEDLKRVVRLEASLIKEKNADPAELPEGNELHRCVNENNLLDCSNLAKDEQLLNELNFAGQTPLMLAVTLARLEIVEVLIKAGAKVDLVDRSGNSALHLAVKQENLAIFRKVLQAGPNINLKNSSGHGAAHLAARSGDFTIFWMLLRAQADLKQKDLGGNTLLHIVCAGSEEKRTKILAALIAKKSDVNSRNFADLTPLHVAVTSGNEQLIKLLVKAGARIDARLPDGNTALFFCRNEFISPLVELGANVDLRNNKGQTAFIEALLRGDRERIASFKRLAPIGKDSLTSGVAKQRAALSRAAASGNLARMKAIIASAPATVEQREIQFGETALHAAVLAEQAAAVELLLKAGANPSAASDFLRTPLHYAAMKGDLRMVKSLIDAGSNIFALDARGSTPLHEAAAAGWVEVYRFLIAQGASDSTPNNAGRSAAELLKIR